MGMDMGMGKGMDMGMGENNNMKKEMCSQGRRLESILEVLLRTSLFSFFLMHPLLTTDQMNWPRAAVPILSFIINGSATCTEDNSNSTVKATRISI